MWGWRLNFVVSVSIVSLVGLTTATPRGVGDADPSDIQGGSFVPAWVKDAIFYQIFPERFANGDSTNDPPGTEPWGGEPTTKNFFGGDLQGIIDHLNYISSLGVNAIYLNPIFEATSSHKYNTTDYLKIDPHFGNESTFKQLVDSCHARGIRIILDGVFNHTGTDFFAFADVKRLGANSKYVSWYNIYSFPIAQPNKPNYESWWGHGSLPKLMTHNPEVQDYLFRVTRHWMELGIDGWRLDVPNEVPHSFWIPWRTLVKSINPEAYIVGEIWDDATPWLQGDQFDAVMNYRFRDACLNFFVTQKTTATQFDSALARQRADYPAGVNYVLQNLLGSHDTERFLTLCNGDSRIMKLALLFQLTYIGAPMIYYGDEVGMKGGKDPACRGTMIWDKKNQDKGMLDFVTQVIKLRKDHEVLRHGTYATLSASDTSGTYEFARRFGDGEAYIALNNSEQLRHVTLPDFAGPGDRVWQKVWPTGTESFEKQGQSLPVPAKSGVVYVIRRRS
jgi:cyclomaltodextrinase / maltogenic alpha-amylase / neopullulanase